MPHDLGWAFDHDIIGAELVLESTVDSLSDRALVITDGIGRLKILFLTPRGLWSIKVTWFKRRQ